MRTLCKLLLAFAGITPLFGQGLTDSEIQQKLLAQPPQSITNLAQKVARHGNPPVIQVDFVNADLGRNGSFAYYVAYYTLEGDTGGFLRVFKLQNGSLAVAGDQDTPQDVGGYTPELHLIDVNGDGGPEVMVSSMTANGQQELFHLFLWTGSSLHDMLGDRVETGTLNDLDNDGILEIVDTRSDGSGFDIYKLSGSDYQFLKTVKDDPRGFIGPNGKINYVRAFCKALEPQHFPLDEIRRDLAGKSKEYEGAERSRVQLTFGGLQRVNAGTVPVQQVDTTTVSVGPHLTPIRVSIRPARDEDRDRERRHDKDIDEICEKDQGRISVEIARPDFLKALQRLHLDGPLTAGDNIEVKLTARLKDGTPVGAVFTAKVVGDRDKDNGSKNKNEKDTGN